MSVINVDEIIKLTSTTRRITAKNHSLLPQHDERGAFRWLIVGPSGSGKTNLIVSAIIQQQIQFDHLYLYARDPSQDKYQFLLSWIGEMEERFRQEHGQSISMVTIETNPEKIVPIDQLNSSIINLVIFDDMILEKNQARIIEYFIRGRHRSANCCYLTQSYFYTPKELRLNCDYFSIFGLPSQNEVVQLMKEHSMGMDNKCFKQMYFTATRDKNDFLHIDRKTSAGDMTFRKNLDQGWSTDVSKEVDNRNQEDDY